MSGTYDQWRLPELLAMVEADGESSATAHLQAWEQKYDLLLRQKRRLEALVADLSAHWDPAKSEAAQTFTDTMASMISILDRASIAVAQTWGGFSHITNAIGDAKVELRMLHTEYNDTAAAVREFNKQAMPFVPDALIPGQPLLPVHALDGIAVQQHQARLDERARRVMNDADVRVNEAATMFRAVPDLGLIDPEGTYDNQPGAVSTGGDSGLPQALKFQPPSPVSASSAPMLAAGPAAPPMVPGAYPLPGPGAEQAGGSPPPAPSWLSNAGGRTSAMRPGGVIGGEALPGPAVPRVGPAANGVLGGPAPGQTVAPRAGVPMSGGAGFHRTQPNPERPRAGRSPARFGPTVEEPVGGSRTSDGGWRDRSFEQYAERRRERRPDNRRIRGRSRRAFRRSSTRHARRYVTMPAPA